MVGLVLPDPLDAPHTRGLSGRSAIRAVEEHQPAPVLLPPPWEQNTGPTSKGPACACPTRDYAMDFWRRVGVGGGF